MPDVQRHERSRYPNPTPSWMKATLVAERYRLDLPREDVDESCFAAVDSGSAVSSTSKFALMLVTDPVRRDLADG